MAARYIRIGSMVDAFGYDDGEYDSAIETNEPIKAGAPVDPTDVLRLGDLGVVVGDVVGPAASTDHAVVRFDGVTGKLLQDSVVIVDDAGNVSGIANITLSGTVDGIDVGVDVAANTVHSGSNGSDHALVLTHATRHESGGADPIQLDDLAAPDDNVDLDFSTLLHGLVPKGTDVGDFLRDDGTWAAAGGAGGGADILEVQVFSF